MKLKYFIPLFLMIASSVTLAGNALITVLDGQGNAMVGEQCVLTSFSFPQSQNGGTAVKWRNSFTTDGSGQINLTNAAPGKWAVDPVDAQAVGFTFNMPVTNGTIRAEYFLTADAGNTLPPDTMSYGVNASDRRYLPAGNADNASINNGWGTNVNLTGVLSINNPNPTNPWVALEVNGRIANSVGDLIIQAGQDNSVGTVQHDLYLNADCGSANVRIGDYGRIDLGGSGNWVDCYTGDIHANNGNIYGDVVGNAAGLTSIPASGIVGGITTNLQFTFSTQRTNTLYFTNGILMRVSQP